HEKDVRVALVVRDDDVRPPRIVDGNAAGVKVPVRIEPGPGNRKVAERSPCRVPPRVEWCGGDPDYRDVHESDQDDENSLRPDPGVDQALHAQNLPARRGRRKTRKLLIGARYAPCDSATAISAATRALFLTRAMFATRLRPPVSTTILPSRNGV